MSPLMNILFCLTHKVSFHYRSRKSQQNIMTPCLNTLPGPEYYGILCLMTALAHMPGLNGSTS